jgi:hypothetical protein
MPNVRENVLRGRRATKQGVVLDGSLLVIGHI